MLLGKPCLLNVRVSAACVSSEQYTGLNCINSDNNDNLAPKTNLTLLNQSSIPCKMNALRIQKFYDIFNFWTHNFQTLVTSKFAVHWL